MSIDPETTKRLSKLIDCVFDHLDEFKDECYVVKKTKPIKSNPILFFGNLYEYLKSETKIVTVGLNPSRREFEKERFNFSSDSNPRSDKEGYIKSLCNYFKFNPYESWFKHYDRFLLRFNATYDYKDSHDSEGPSIALHTDLLTPLATNPAWTDLKLSKDKEDKLIKSGFKIWSKLMCIIQPDIIICSIGEDHIKRLDTFGPHSMEAFGPEFPRKKKEKIENGEEIETHRVSRIKSDKYNIFHLVPTARRRPLGMPKKQYPCLASLIKSKI